MWVSWSWKWTLINNIKKLNLENIHIPLSYKTRQIRETEKNWVDAYFITKEQFFNWIELWEFLEYAILYDWEDYYWTKYKDVIDNWINLGKIVIKELDINWLKRLKKERPELDSYYTTIFLNIPVDILKQRIKKRWALMNNEELERRINTSIIEENEALKLCDYIIDATKSEEEVLKEFLSIINKKSNVL